MNEKTEKTGSDNEVSTDDVDAENLEGFPAHSKTDSQEVKMDRLSEQAEKSGMGIPFLPHSKTDSAEVKQEHRDAYMADALSRDVFVPEAANE